MGGRLADAILAETHRRRLHPSGRWQRSPGDPRVDASLLLPRSAEPSPPTILAPSRLSSPSRSELTEDGYCYRFRPDERPLGTAEGAFLYADSGWRWPSRSKATG